MLVLTAVSLVALLGFVGLALDAGFLFAKRNRLYAAADAAAKSGAYEVHRSSTLSPTELRRFAAQEVTAHNFTPASCGATSGAALCVNRPPTSGSFFGNTNFVEVTVSESTATFFGRALGWISAAPGARAVAGVGNPANCVTVMQDVGIGNMTITLNGCGLGVGGNLAGNNPNSTVNGTPEPPVTVAGSCSGTCTHMGDLTAPGGPSPSDPLSTLPAFSNPYGSCSAGAAATLSQGCYTSIASSVSTLNAGEYYITGTVNIGNLTGTNVFLYLAPGARLQAGNNQQLHLTGRSSGTYAGIAVFQDRTNSNAFTVGNQFTMDVNGAIYMKSAAIVTGNSLSITQTGCTILIANSLSINNGNGVMSNSGCSASFGGAAFLSVVIAE